jgi:hypothetical protein
MTKEEARSSVIGAISMTLKDPILQQGFEIICKNLLELEKENSKHKEMIEDMKADMCSTKNKVLCDYLIGILKKYGEIV